MFEFLDKIINKFKTESRVLLVDDNSMGKITIEFELFYTLLERLLKDYDFFDNAEIEIDQIKETEYRLYIIVKKEINHLSDKKLSIIKNKIISSFKSCGLILRNVVIVHKDILKE
ncbi:MAG: hypothetical protein U5K53_07705 [Halanaerobiales bacterium]|nr:hypothetical protein [Halanaerobiales bacterium]